MTDWPSLIRLAAVRFHIAPHAFWRLSVKEWAALSAPPPANALGRRGLNALMSLHPDSHSRGSLQRESENPASGTLGAAGFSD